MDERMTNDKLEITNDTLFEQFQSKICEIVDEMDFGLSHDEMNAIEVFIARCSISDFEKLKEMDYELTNADNDEE